MFHATEEPIVHSSTTRIYPLRQESIVGGLLNCMEPGRGETCILDRDKAVWSYFWNEQVETQRYMRRVQSKSEQPPTLTIRDGQGSPAIAELLRVKAESVGPFLKAWQEYRFFFWLALPHPSPSIFPALRTPCLIGSLPLCSAGGMSEQSFDFSWIRYYVHHCSTIQEEAYGVSVHRDRLTDPLLMFMFYTFWWVRKPACPKQNVGQLVFGT